MIHSVPLADALLVAVALVGLADASYFVLVQAGRIRPDARFVPSFCRMEGDRCGRIINHPSARVLGLPNSVYGVAWYAAVAAFPLLAGTLPREEVLCAGYLAASGVTVVLSAYLLWVLRVRLRTHCPLCYVGHAVNAALAVLLALRCFA